MPNRKGDGTKSWFHSGRIYHTPAGWWFSTREHTEEGPFESLQEAEAVLCLYIRSKNLSKSAILNSQTSCPD